MNFHFLLSVAVLLAGAARGGVQPWAPCSSLNANVCVSSNFAARPTGGVSSDYGLGASGTWSVAANTLSESSRATGTGAGDACVRQLGVVQYMPITNLSSLYQVRVKVRVNATAGAGGILFGDRDGSYFRFQLQTDASCTHSSAVAFRTALQGTPATFSKVTQLDNKAARVAQWYELRLRITYADSTHGRLDVSIIEQNPQPGFVLTGPSTTLDSPSLSVGSKIGLWCSSSSGCDFKDYVIVQDSLRGALTGQLDCHACNLMWLDGQSDWCRCCQQDCVPFDRNACVAKGLCTSLCASNQYCAAPTTPAGTGSPSTPATTAAATTTTTTTTTAPVGTGAATTTTTTTTTTTSPVGTGNPATTTTTGTAPVGTGSDTTSANSGASNGGGDSTTTTVNGGSGSTTNSAAASDVTIVPSSATIASAATAMGVLAAAAAVI
jgi:hypothetical protein